MIIARLLKYEPVKNWIIKLDKNRSDGIIQKIKPYLKPNDSIIDVGAGFCLVNKKLKEEGYKVISIDIKNISLFDDVTPVIYDGQRLPFNNNHFDTALLITVLHHTGNPELTLGEAKRVAKKIIIIEDVYENVWQKYLTYFMDNLVNMEFINNPHSNRTDLQWRKLFRKLKLNIRGYSQHSFWKFFISATYCLIKS